MITARLQAVNDTGNGDCELAGKSNSSAGKAGLTPVGHETRAGYIDAIAQSADHESHEHARYRSVVLVEASRASRRGARVTN